MGVSVSHDIAHRTAPLPFYALSNLLTLFSHDMPTLELNQHVFDYLLCRPPITVVYLATAVSFQFCSVSLLLLSSVVRLATGAPSFIFRRCGLLI